MPRVPAHQVTTRNLGAAYPFIAEAGLGQRGVVIGDDLLGGPFVFDPFELYATGATSNPNMVGFACARSGEGRVKPSAAAPMRPWWHRARGATERSVYTAGPANDF